MVNKAPCVRCGVICVEKMCCVCEKPCYFHITWEDDSDFDEQYEMESDEEEYDPNSHWVACYKLNCQDYDYEECDFCRKPCCVKCLCNSYKWGFIGESSACKNCEDTYRNTERLRYRKD